MTEPALVLVIARNIPEARAIISEMDVPGRAVPASPRSIHYGVARGLIVTDVVVDENIWPLNERVLALLGPPWYPLATWWLRTSSGLEVLHP